jgi:aminopeptidase N
MSSYLVAMIIADYSYVESNASHNNITFRVWARHSAINQTKYENFFKLSCQNGIDRKSIVL